jgi:hypothetical protein
VVGLYQRNPGRTIAQTTARVVLSLMLAVPVAWAIFTFMPRAEEWDVTLRLAVPLAFVTFVAIRGIAAHSGMSPMFARRTLVLGTGAEAVAVEQSIGHLGQAVRFLGFFPAKKTVSQHSASDTRNIRKELLPTAARSTNNLEFFSAPLKNNKPKKCE